jgi:hypothetical protein
MIEKIVSITRDRAEVTFSSGESFLFEKRGRRVENISPVRRYLSPSEYGEIMTALHSYWGISYHRRPFTLAAVARRKKETRKVSANKGVQKRLF